MELSIVIPARNEARRIAETLAAYAGEFAHDTEILVVVNGSTDATAEIARQVAAPHPHVTVIEILAKIGKGGAVRAGFARAQGTWVGFVDADQATPAAEFRRIFAAAKTADGAFGSRWLPGSRVHGRSPLRGVASRIFLGLVKLAVGLRCADSQCGAKVFHRRFLPGYLASSWVNDLAFDVELLLLLRRAGARLLEVPTEWWSQPGSAALGSPLSFLRHALSMMGTVARLRRERGIPAIQPEPAAPRIETRPNGAR